MSLTMALTTHRISGSGICQICHRIESWDLVLNLTGGRDLGSWIRASNPTSITSHRGIGSSILTLVS